MHCIERRTLDCHKFDNFNVFDENSLMNRETDFTIDQKSVETTKLSPDSTKND